MAADTFKYQSVRAMHKAVMDVSYSNEVKEYCLKPGILFQYICPGILVYT